MTRRTVTKSLVKMREENEEALNQMRHLVYWSLSAMDQLELFDELLQKLHRGDVPAQASINTLRIKLDRFWTSTPSDSEENG